MFPKNVIVLEKFKLAVNKKIKIKFGNNLLKNLTLLRTEKIKSYLKHNYNSTIQNI